MSQRELFSKEASESAQALANNHVTDDYLRHFVCWDEPDDAHLWFIWMVDNGNPPDKLVDESNKATIHEALEEYFGTDVVEIWGRPEALFAVRIWREITLYYTGEDRQSEVNKLTSKVSCSYCTGTDCQKCGGSGELLLHPLQEEAEVLLGPLYEKPADLSEPHEIVIRKLTPAFECVNELACILYEYPILDDADYSARKYHDGLDNIENVGWNLVDKSKVSFEGFRWERIVFNWLLKHNQEALNVDGEYYPKKSAIAKALYHLGLMDEDTRQEYEETSTANEVYGRDSESSLKEEQRHVQFDRKINAAYEASQLGHKIGNGLDGCRIDGGTFKNLSETAAEAACTVCGAKVAVDLTTGEVTGEAIQQRCKPRNRN